LAWGGLMLWPAYAVAVVGEGFFNGRQAYVPSIAIPILLAALWNRIPIGRVAAGGTLLTFGVLAWMVYATVASALVWRTNVGVYSQSMMLSPSAAGPRAAIAESLAGAGEIDQAIAMYAGAAARASKVGEKAGYLYEMGRILGQAGRIAESNRQLGQVIELEPAHSHALTGLGNNAWIEGRTGEAEYYYRRAISANPGNGEAIANLQRLRSAR
jgi:tetratricopeptide (TPR) repeat protein